jgi:hypothetical protein
LRLREAASGFHPMVLSREATPDHGYSECMANPMVFSREATQDRSRG